jgi:hypothetical protein
MDKFTGPAGIYRLPIGRRCTTGQVHNLKIFGFLVKCPAIIVRFQITIFSS